MNLVRRFPVASFFVLACAISWPLLGAFVYLLQNVYGGEFQFWLLVFLPGAWGPTIAAFIVVGRVEGRAGVWRLIRSAVDVRQSPLWYAFVVLVPLFVTIAAVALSRLGPAAFANASIGEMAEAAPLYVAVALPFGPLGEESGWRGYAMPRLMARGNALLVSLFLGSVWTLWHLPLYWQPGASIPSFQEVSPETVALYAAYITGLTFLYTALWLGTNGSVFLAILFHAFNNAAENIVFSGIAGEIPDAARAEIYEIGIVVTWVVGVPLLLNVARRRRTTGA
jgi:CAAX protease family protein